jgi:MoaD family protein
MAQVKLFGMLRQHADSAQFESPGDTVLVLLSTLCAANTPLRSAILNDQGQLKPHFRVMVNGHDIDLLQGLDTRLEETDIVAILPPIAGG